DLGRTPPVAAVSDHRTVQDGDAAAIADAPEDHGAGRRARPAARPDGQYVGTGAAADRGMDEPQPLRPGAGDSGRGGYAGQPRTASGLAGRCRMRAEAVGPWRPAASPVDHDAAAGAAEPAGTAV